MIKFESYEEIKGRIMKVSQQQINKWKKTWNTVYILILFEKMKNK